MSVKFNIFGFVLVFLQTTLSSGFDYLHKFGLQRYHHTLPTTESFLLNLIIMLTVKLKSEIQSKVFCISKLLSGLPLSSQTPTLDFMGRGHLKEENHILDSQVLKFIK